MSPKPPQKPGQQLDLNFCTPFQYFLQKVLEWCAKNEVQNAVPNRSIDFSIVKSIFLKGCVRPLFGHFLQFSHFVLFFLSLLVAWR